MEQRQKKAIMFKLAITWLAIILLGSFWLTAREAADLVSMVVVPEVPREGEPIVATFKVNNSLPQATVVKYQFYANGALLKEGTTSIADGSSKTYQYAYENSLPLGEQSNFIVRVQSAQGNYEKALSSPSYPPQIWSSFVSFASFSTSVMSAMSTMTYYQTTFLFRTGVNIGIILVMVLVLLLIFLETTKPSVEGRVVGRLGGLRIRLSTITWILFIIFMGMVYTRIMMAFAT